MTALEFRTTIFVMTVVILYLMVAVALALAAKWSPVGRAQPRTVAQAWAVATGFPVFSLLAMIGIAVGAGEWARVAWLPATMLAGLGLAMTPTLIRRFTGDEHARYSMPWIIVALIAGGVSWALLIGAATDPQELMQRAVALRALGSIVAVIISIQLLRAARRAGAQSPPLRLLALGYGALAMRVIVVLPLSGLLVQGIHGQLLALLITVLTTGIAPVAFLGALASAQRQAIRVRYAQMRDVDVQLARAQRETRLGQLADGLAQEFARVVEGVQEVAADLSSEESTDDVVKQSTQLLRDASQHASVIVRQLRDCSETMPTPRSSFDLAALVERNLAALQALAPGHRVALGTMAHARILGAPEQLERALYSLVANARDASADGQMIWVSVERLLLGPGDVPPSDRELPVGAYARLRVADAGCGIAEEDLESIWQPYFTTKETSGTGLGLPASRTIVRAHGGELTLVSRIGVGTSADIWIPLTSQSHAAVA
jgi:signal transduction histidine kinase